MIGMFKITLSCVLLALLSTIWEKDLADGYDFDYEVYEPAEDKVTIYRWEEWGNAVALNESEYIQTDWGFEVNQSLNEGTTFLPPVISKYTNGTIVTDYLNGGRQTEYPNGTRVERYPHGNKLTFETDRSTVTHYANGGNHTIYVDGGNDAIYVVRTVTQYPNGGPKFTFYKNEIKVEEYSRGERYTKYPNRTEIKEYNNETIETLYPNGTKWIVFLNRSTVFKMSDGTDVFTVPNVRTDVTRPDGTIETTFANKTIVTNYPNGLVVAKPPNHNASESDFSYTRLISYMKGWRGMDYYRVSGVTKYPSGITVTKHHSGYVSIVYDSGMEVRNYPHNKAIETIKPGGPIYTRYKTSTMEIVYAGGLRELRCGSTERSYPNGTSIREFWDGTRESNYTNGPFIREFRDGSIDRAYPNGTLIRESWDGTLERTYPDGSMFTKSPNGTVVRTYPMGLLVTEFINGTIEKTYPNGTLEYAYPNKTKLFIFPDGMVEIQRDYVTHYHEPRTPFEYDWDLWDLIHDKAYPSYKSLKKYPNGTEIKEDFLQRIDTTYPNGTYWSISTDSYTWLVIPGLKRVASGHSEGEIDIEYFCDERSESYYDDGRYEVTYKNKTMTTYHLHQMTMERNSDGTKEGRYPNGVRLKYFLDGRRALLYPSEGLVVVVFSNGTVRFKHHDGTIHMIYKNRTVTTQYSNSNSGRFTTNNIMTGIQVTRYPDGRIETTKDPDRDFYYNYGRP